MITKEEVQHIAGLARIRVNEHEIEKLQEDLSEILEYFAILEKVDTSLVDAKTHSIALENIVREDNAHSTNPTCLQNLMAMFPAVREGLLRVKAILTLR